MYKKIKLLFCAVHNNSEKSTNSISSKVLSKVYLILGCKHFLFDRNTDSLCVWVKCVNLKEIKVNLFLLADSHKSLCVQEANWVNQNFLQCQFRLRSRFWVCIQRVAKYWFYIDRKMPLNHFPPKNRGTTLFL